MKQTTKEYSSYTHSLAAHESVDSPFSSASYQQVCLQGQSEQDVQQAILDLFKSIYLSPSAANHILRGKLHAASGKYLSSINDYETAEALCKQAQGEKDLSAEQSEAKKFVEESFCMKNLTLLKQAAECYEKTSKIEVGSRESSRTAKILSNLLLANERMETNMKQMHNKLEQQLQLQAERQRQLQELLQYKEHQIKQLREEMDLRVVDYETKFLQEIEQSIGSETNKQKYCVYYRGLVSAIEKIYLAAKVLEEFDEKTKLRFQDYNGIGSAPHGQMKVGNTFPKEIIEKIFKVMDKNKSKVDKIEAVIKQLPYLGSGFKVMKSAMKGFGWFQAIRTQDECHNILNIRTNLTSFTQFSTQLAYHMYKHFKLKIAMTTSSLYQYSCWEEISRRYKEIRNNHIGVRLFPNLTEKQRNYTREIAQVHAMIFMTGVAFGVFRFHPFSFPSEEQLEEIFAIIEKVEEKLLVMKIDDVEQLPDSGNQGDQVTTVNEKGVGQRRCAIF